jgi:hypothetical protein
VRTPSSLQEIARRIGMRHTSLDKFLAGSEPYVRNRSFSVRGTYASTRPTRSWSRRRPWRRCRGRRLRMALRCWKGLFIAERIARGGANKRGPATDHQRARAGGTSDRAWRTGMVVSDLSPTTAEFVGIPAMTGERGLSPPRGRQGAERLAPHTACPRQGRTVCATTSGEWNASWDR